MSFNQRTSFVQILLKIPVPWVFILTYLTGVVLQLIFPIANPSVAVSHIAMVAGIILFATGAIFASWSLLIFHKARTTTTPGESSKRLITDGPYRLTRNPMYISLLLAYLGEAGLLAQCWPVIVLPLMTVYLNRIVIPLEEDILRKDFKEEFKNYCSRVNRWF